MSNRPIGIMCSCKTPFCDCLQKAQEEWDQKAVKMKVFGTDNRTPIVSKDSYSGYYRDFKMTYECMIEVRKLEAKLLQAENNLVAIRDVFLFVDTMRYEAGKCLEQINPEKAAR